MSVTHTARMSKLKYRFNVDFFGFCTTIDDDNNIKKQLYSVKLPAITFNDEDHHDQIIIELIDDYNNFIETAISKRIESQINKNDSFSCTVNLIGTDSELLKTIKFSKCKLSRVEYSELNYSSDDVCMFKLYIDIIR